MSKFAEALSSHLDHTVVDKTQLDGVYSFDVKWNLDNASGPSIFAAVEEQLGLKLQRGNQDTELLVIDKAQKSPTVN